MFNVRILTYVTAGVNVRLWVWDVQQAGGTDAELPLQNVDNVNALCSAMSWCIVVPWLVCLGFFVLLHQKGYYAADRDRERASEAREHQVRSALADPRIRAALADPEHYARLRAALHTLQSQGGVEAAAEAVL
jgi:hypothetical protein